jgi:glutathione S-transferase
MASEADFRNPEFAALNPRRRVPIIEDDGFALYESAAIVEYLETSLSLFRWRGASRSAGGPRPRR